MGLPHPGITRAGQGNHPSPFVLRIKEIGDVKNVSKKVIDNQYTGPGTHVSLDQTVNTQPVADYAPSGDKAEYPKYVYHQDGRSQVVNSKEEHDGLDGFGETPAPQTIKNVPFGADAHDLESMSRSELATFGNLNFGLDLKASMSRDALLSTIEQAAELKSASGNPTPDADAPSMQVDTTPAPLDQQAGE